ncbi:MAG: vsrD [Gammaproteobacteria bacterium]|jgi:DNA-binding NarL/FixJ family response regulator|nr:vsrD [Gammaproteobacteria bacterium]
MQGVCISFTVNKDDQPKIKVMIANDHPIMRVGLRMAVRRERDMEVVGETRGARDSIEQFQRVLPDVLLLDLDSPDQSGPDTVEAIHRAYPNLPLLVLSSYPIDANELLRQPSPGPGPGPVMFILKSSSGEEIIAALRTVVVDFCQRESASRL